IHLERLSCGRLFPSTETISIAFAGQSLLHEPQPMHKSKSKTGWPRKLSDNWGFTKGYLADLVLVKTCSTAFFAIEGIRSFFANLHTPAIWVRGNAETFTGTAGIARLPLGC